MGNLVQRFFEKVTFPVTDRGCLEFTGCVNEKGYGLFSVKNRSRLAHRVSWSLLRGDIPAGMALLHSCDNPRCVNIDHLSIGTRAENNADMIRKGRMRAGEHQRARTKCAKGHPYDSANTAVDDNGYRRCRACSSESCRRFKAARKAVDDRGKWGRSW
jgi:hypothetical protein